MDNNNYTNDNFGYQSNSTMGNMGMNTNQGYTLQNAPDFMLWLILGLIQTISCCCGGCIALITGIITIVFACMANDCYKSNNMAVYQSKMQVAKIVNIIGWILSVLCIIASIFTGVFNKVMELVN